MKILMKKIKGYIYNFDISTLHININQSYEIFTPYEYLSKSMRLFIFYLSDYVIGTYSANNASVVSFIDKNITTSSYQINYNSILY